MHASPVWSIYLIHLWNFSTQVPIWVQITNDLSWNEHNDGFCNKATELQHYACWTCSIQVKSNKRQAYKGTALEYASSFSDPHQIYIWDRSESVQKCSVRFIESKYSSLGQNVQVKPLGLELAMAPLLPRMNFAHYDFLKLHYIRQKIKDVSSLRVAALTCNITLYTLPPPPPKKALNVPDNVSTMTCSYIFACWHMFMNFL